jgi:stearoyl-CoA desaturase (delta-9 desaturase)
LEKNPVEASIDVHGRSHREPASRPRPKATRIQQSIAVTVAVVPVLGVLAALFLGLEDGISSVEIGILVGMYSLGMLGLTLGFHRYFAHQAFKAGKGMQVILAILGSMSAQDPLFTWVADHRRHHVYSDQPGDPHSPQLHGQSKWQRLKGFGHAHMGWKFSNEVTNWARFVPDLLNNKLLFRMHRLYLLWVVVGLVFPAILGWALTGKGQGAWTGFLWGGLVRIFLVHQAFGFIGSLAHMYGGRPFREKTKDCSTNNFFVALVAFGEGNQNNHHAFPFSAQQGFRWWQPDVTFWVVRILEGLRLVRDVKTPKKIPFLRQ